MRHGVLFDNHRGRRLEQAARLARRQFEQAEHTKELKPAELHFNPGDFPQLEGLILVPDPAVKSGCLRLCTQDLGPGEEWDLSKQYVGAQVEARSNGN